MNGGTAPPEPKLARKTCHINRSSVGSSPKLRLAHINIGGGFHKKIDEISKIASENDIDIVAISETFLQDDPVVPGFQWVGKNNNEGIKRKGVGFLLTNKIRVFIPDQVMEIMDPKLDIQWIGLDTETLSLATAVVNVPSGCIQKFRDELWDYLDRTVRVFDKERF